MTPTPFEGQRSYAMQSEAASILNVIDYNNYESSSDTESCTSEESLADNVSLSTIDLDSEEEDERDFTLKLLWRIPRLSNAFNTSHQILDNVEPLTRNAIVRFLWDDPEGEMEISAAYRFVRMPRPFTSVLSHIVIAFNNRSRNNIINLKIREKPGEVYNKIRECQNIPLIPRSNTKKLYMIADFNDCLKAVSFNVTCSLGHFSGYIRPRIGELIKPVILSEPMYDGRKRRLKGKHMHYHYFKDASYLQETIKKAANVALCPSNINKNILKYAGVTLKKCDLILLTVEENLVTINSQSPEFGAILLHEIIALHR